MKGLDLILWNLNFSENIIKHLINDIGFCYYWYKITRSFYNQEKRNNNNNNEQSHGILTCIHSESIVESKYI